MAESGKRALIVSKGWIQAVAIVVVFGFFVLGLLAYRTYSDEPPIPERVVGQAGGILFNHQDVVDGQGVFLRNGLMEYGSILGHGAYLGPDFTADYLHRAALIVIDQYGGPSSDQARARTITDFTSNRYDSETGTLIFSAAQVEAFRTLETHYHNLFADPTSKFGLRPEAITEPQQTRQLTAFFCWTAWAASARRPDLTYSYTNNWPPEPLVDNHPTADTVIWSVLSLVALLGGIGILLAAFGRWNFLGWHGSEQQAISFRPPE
jgi:nitric oxide reductase subunit B